MQGHKLRHEVIQRYGDATDIYGLDNWVNPIEAYAPYKYSIIIENERCPGYFTEKLIDCISVGTIPVYCGCHDVGRYFINKGIVIVEDIDDIQWFLSNLVDFDYQTFVPAAKENILLAEHYRMVEDWIYREYPFLFKEIE